MSSTAIPKVVPAQLSFLAIYNPSLGETDETFHNQIVFYYSKAAKALSKSHGVLEQDLREQENEKLRQIGLAQGMVGFARSFSNGDAVDSVETERSRIVLHELEEGWWILASIDLTQLPAAHATSETGGRCGTTSQPTVEYSSREVSPPALLLHQIIRAYSIFLLHHGSTLETLFAKLDRPKFCSTLDRYWSKFATNWDVLLHGSPAVDIFGGLKLAAGGELGMGVGEEEWGSGEREVLEDFARRTEGLVDIMVSRFGGLSPTQHPKPSANAHLPDQLSNLEPWIGSGRGAEASDGVVFSGIGAMSRQSLRDMAQWVESIYTYGDYAYGVRDNPTAPDRRKRRRRNPKPSSDISSDARKSRPSAGASIPSREPGLPPGIPPPIVKAVETSLDKASNAVETSNTGAPKAEPMYASLGDTETWMKYLTLGYGTAWGGKAQPSIAQPLAETPSEESANYVEESPEMSMRYVEPTPDVDKVEERLKAQIHAENTGYFLIGLKGDMDHEDVDDGNEDGAWNNRILLRTVHVELAKEDIMTPGLETPLFDKQFSFQPSSARKLYRLRPIVYVHRPFIYTFMFHHRTESLTLASFYRNLHTYFSPLHRPLSNSTFPDRVAVRISAASHPHTTTSSAAGSGPNEQPIYDLVYDPRTLTVHSSIPNIPDPGSLIAEGLSSTTKLSCWSRVEALNVHSQILATVAGTRRSFAEIERTCKTSRGWWVVWLRLPPSQVETAQNGEAETDEFNTADLREAFLIRRSRDTMVSTTKNTGKRLGSGMWRLGGPSTQEKMGGAAAGWGPKGLAEGIGIDARRYVEGLLSLNR